MPRLKTYTKRTKWCFAQGVRGPTINLTKSQASKCCISYQMALLFPKKRGRSLTSCLRRSQVRHNALCTAAGPSEAECTNILVLGVVLVANAVIGDELPAAPDSWTFRTRNNFMFQPDLESAKDASQVSIAVTYGWIVTGDMLTRLFDRYQSRGKQTLTAH